MSRRLRPPRAAGAGFTLVEIAVTIVIVGIGLTLVLQALNTATTQAGQTRNMKLARDLGLLTLGQISAGLYQDDLRDRFFGTYGEEGYPGFEFEVALGEEIFEEMPDPDDPNRPYYDSWNDPDKLDDEEDEDEEATQPYEKVKIKVTFPKLGDYKNHVILESWLPWEQVYGPDEDEEQDTETNPS